MANSKYAYVKDFELPDALLPGTFIVIRIDGRSFHRFSEEHNFTKPNDVRALRLMDAAAMHVMKELRDVVLAFGESDEYSFLAKKSSILFNRRSSKILSTIVSTFTSAYIFHWQSHFSEADQEHVGLKYPPSFDGRIVLYPDPKHVRDYFAWRQTDTHVNNLYNTVFWALVQQGGSSTTEAHARLRGTVSAQKHNILFTEFGVNYNSIDERFRKGSVLVWQQKPTLPEGLSEKETTSVESPGGETLPTVPVQKLKLKQRRGKDSSELVVMHCDVIQDTFWDANPHLLSG